MATPIFDEKNQRWRLRVTENGITKNFTSGKKGLAGKREVMAKARSWMYGSVSPQFYTVKQCWAYFMDMNEARLGAQSESYAQYEKLGRLYILPAIGRMKMQSVKKGNWQRILDEAKPQNKRTKVLSKKYLKNIRTTINVFVKFCIEYEYYEGFKGELYIPQGHPTVGRQILQPSQIKKLFDPSPLTYHRALCFMVCTGMRPGEVIGLKWSDIQGEVLTINRAINTKGVETAGKNANARRAIPLTPFTRRILDEQRTATESLRSDWVFCNAIGERGCQSTMGHHYDQLAEERGLGGSVYSLRHTFVSMVKNSMPEQMVKTIVGHSATMDTFGVYGHTVDGELRQAAEIMDLTFMNIKEEATK